MVSACLKSPIPQFYMMSCQGSNLNLVSHTVLHDSFIWFHKIVKIKLEITNLTLKVIQQKNHTQQSGFFSKADGELVELMEQKCTVFSRQAY